MESTLLSGSTNDWLVIGSNGSVGSELTEALIQSAHIDRTSIVSTICHPRESYAQACLNILQNRAFSCPLRLLFCAGKGGFALPETSAKEQQDTFELFCRKMLLTSELDKFVLISSLGAHCSKAANPYSSLIKANERNIINCFGERALILRLPSLYGYNKRSRRYHGLAGVLWQNHKLHAPTRIYARMESRRNYLSVRQLARQLILRSANDSWIKRNGCLNIQAAMSHSIFEVCTSFFKATRQRPVVKLVGYRSVDTENHYPQTVEGDKIVIDDSVYDWLKWQMTFHTP